jgi:type I restriction enzyme M protein
MEHVQDTHRLALMNLMLHGLESDPAGAGVRYGDTLSPEGQALPRASLILTNPPFGTKKGGGLPTRTDFTFPTSNKQFAFLQHIYRALQPGGRAGVVLPDNVLFEGNVGRQIRADLMDKCNLHTILRLPTGIFYAQGVKTNVLFFTRGATEKGNTQEVWVYDLRANMPSFGKRTPLTRAHFADFEAAFGDDPWGRPESLAQRVDTGESGRFRRFTREWIAERGDSLDISWLKDERAGAGDALPEPAALAAEAMIELVAAIEELRGILAELGEVDVEEEIAE